VCSREYRALYDAFRSGDWARAALIHTSLLELFDALFAVTNPIPIKWVMGEMGFAAGRCRSPLDTIPEQLAQRLQSLIAGYLTNV
jgi:4-hydroxy-tetrahydrodipicolinate synthase